METAHKSVAMDEQWVEGLKSPGRKGLVSQRRTQTWEVIYPEGLIGNAGQTYSNVFSHRSFFCFYLVPSSKFQKKGRRWTFILLTLIFQSTSLEIRTLVIYWTKGTPIKSLSYQIWIFCSYLRILRTNSCFCLCDHSTQLTFQTVTNISLIFLLRINITYDKKIIWKYSHGFWHGSKDLVINQCQNPN